MKSKVDILQTIDALVAQGTALPYSASFVAPSGNAEAQYWLSKTIAASRAFSLPPRFISLKPSGSLKEAIDKVEIFKADVDALLGHLRFLRDGVEGDLLRSLQNEISAADFADFVGHARHYLEEGKKVEASVIAAATFEDAVKRLAQAYGVGSLSKLDTSISALKTKGVVSSIEAKRLRYLAGIRNSAFHASWDEFDLDAVRDLLEGVERLLRLGASTVEDSWRESNVALGLTSGLRFPGVPAPPALILFARS